MNTKKYALISLASLSMLLGACGTTATKEKTSVSTEVEVVDEKTIPVSVKIIVDEEEVSDLTKEIEAEEGQSLMDVMKENYEIDEEDGFLKGIEGYEQSEEDNKWWMFQVNGEEGEVGAADYEVLENDDITWELTKFE